MRYVVVLILMAISNFVWAQSAPANILKSPNVSANALFWYQNSNRNDENASTTRNGVDIRETEIALYADVDPYTRLYLLLAVHPEYEDVGDRVEQSWIVEPEEAYADSNVVPSLTLKVGKFKAAMGKHNILHTHAFPFAEAPLINQELLGGEGLNDVGVSAAWLIPTGWFSELTTQYLRGEGENEAFNSATPSDGVGLVNWKNLWDLSEASTLEFGTSYAFGPNSLGGDTQLLNANLTWKFRPIDGGKYHSWKAAIEYLDRRVGQSSGPDDHGYGYAAWLQYQLAQRWQTGGRWEELENAGSKSNRGTLSVEFLATEFSQYRLDLSRAYLPPDTDSQRFENKVMVQANFTIGAHPAHAY